MLLALSRAVIGSAVLGAACSAESGTSGGDQMRCPSTRTVTTRDVLEDLDANDDGFFDEEDVSPGSSLLVVKYQPTGAESSLLVSSDERAQLLSHQHQPGATQTWGAQALFGVWHEFSFCTQSGWITPWFTDSGGSNGPHPSQGIAPMHYLSFDIASIEHGNIGQDNLVEAAYNITRADGGTSGHLLDPMAVNIISYTSQELVGSAEVIAHAFHGI